MPGTQNGLFTRICRPLGPGPFRLVVVNHGSPSPGADPLEMRPQSCSGEVASWFLAHGFMVMFPLRRGFGLTAGPIVEGSGPCDAPNYVDSGLAGAADIAAAVTYASALPDAEQGNAVVVGHSTGGWAVVAYDSLPHPGVTALINMAGGRGAWAGGQPGLNCRPDLLVEAARSFASHAGTPMLWIYAANDTWFPPSLAERVAQAYRSAGGTIDFMQPKTTVGDGHFIFDAPGGSAVWGPAVEHYLAERSNVLPDKFSLKQTK